MKKWFVLFFAAGFFLINGCGNKPASTLSDSNASQASDTTSAGNGDSSSVSAATADSSDSGEKVGTYEVQKGDTLWTIARKPEVYGSGWLYPLIYKANSDVLRNPNHLKAGMKLLVPRGQSNTELEAAKEEAMAAEYSSPQKANKENSLANNGSASSLGVSGAANTSVNLAALNNGPNGHPAGNGPIASNAGPAPAMHRAPIKAPSESHTLLYAVLGLIVVVGVAAYYFTRS